MYISFAAQIRLDQGGNINIVSIIFIGIRLLLAFSHTMVNEVYSKFHVTLKKKYSVHVWRWSCADSIFAFLLLKKLTATDAYPECPSTRDLNSRTVANLYSIQIICDTRAHIK